MKEKFRSVRGTRDVLPEEAVKWQYLERAAREVAESYGYGQIRVPTMEKTGLFIRSVGETTDVVQKEMYSFIKGDENITLRPEGTAGTVRAVLENGMLNDAFPVKLWYALSCFRHENPQAGRYREFNQFGIECFGAQSPIQDAEVIALGDDLLFTLGITGVEIYINSIGCKNCRPSYNEKLIAYYNKHKDTLCETCLDRLERNPIRLLDCKEEGCQPTKADAPRIKDHLCEDCSDHFEGLKAALEKMGLKYKINPDIVRGLDYYSKTVFEFVTTQIGAQGTLCGGGRYDGLVEEMGGPETPGIGFAMGMERLLMTMEACGAEFPPASTYALYIGSTGQEESRVALDLACKLRAEGFYVLSDTMERSVRAQMKYADKKEVGYSCIIGSNEMETGEVGVKNMTTGEITNVKINGTDFSEFLWAKIQEEVIGDDTGLESFVENILE